MTSERPVERLTTARARGAVCVGSGGRCCAAAAAGAHAMLLAQHGRRHCGLVALAMRQAACSTRRRHAACGCCRVPASDARSSRVQVIGNKWDTYMDLLQAGYTEG